MFLKLFQLQLESTASFIKIEVKNNTFKVWKGKDKNKLLFSIEDKFMNHSVKTVKIDHGPKILPAIVYSSESKSSGILIYSVENMYHHYNLLLVGTFQN